MKNLFDYCEFGDLKLNSRIVRTGLWESEREKSGNLTPEIYNRYENIAASGVGLIITELEPDEKYNSEIFPLRNRIVSGLAEGVIVIEARYRSGTSITVNYAKAQNKLVFAIPGRLDDIASVGVNKFIH